MVCMFGAKNMTDCTEITERLAIKEDGWEMTRIYTYADGTSKSVIGENENYYCLVPAAPGWIAATDSITMGNPLAITTQSQCGNTSSMVVITK